MWMWQGPREISLDILSLLPLKDLEQCRLVCKHWRQYLDGFSKPTVSWLTAKPRLYDISLRPHNAVALEHEPDCEYALHPIVNVGSDFFIFERKANERFASRLHVVHKCDYEGTVTLERQNSLLVPFDVLSVDQERTHRQKIYFRVLASYSKPGSISHHNASPEQRESCFNTVEIFERKTLKPLPWHLAFTNVVTMCKNNSFIYHLCFLKDVNSTSGRRFALFALDSALEWREVASTSVSTLTRLVWGEEHTSFCALNMMTCRPHLQVEDDQAMWTCGTHANRLFLADLNDGLITMMSLDVGSYSERRPIPFNCPTVLFGGRILGAKIRSRDYLFFVNIDLINISTGQVLLECPTNRNLHQICSPRFLVYIMELHEPQDFLLLCVDKNGYEIRKATFPYYPHGFWNDIRMIINEELHQLVIHIVSNEVYTSLRCSNHVFVLDLTQPDLNVGLRVFDLGLSNYPPAVSAHCGLVMRDVALLRGDADSPWYKALAMQALDTQGYIKLGQQCRGVQRCGSGYKPMYLSNCKEGIWNRQGEWGLRCIWCNSLIHTHTVRPHNIIPFRMEPNVMLFEDSLLFKCYDPNGDLDETNIEFSRNFIHQLKGLCKGFLPDLNNMESEPLEYLPCNSTGEEGCFHTRWKAN